MTRIHHQPDQFRLSAGTGFDQNAAQLRPSGGDSNTDPHRRSVDAVALEKFARQNGFRRRQSKLPLQMYDFRSRVGFRVYDEDHGARLLSR
jgi:hypothetical protein